MDYLPIQAMSVPCERMFSSAKETDTVKQSQLSPVLMEALQLLKFSIKKEWLNFMNGWATSSAAMNRVEPTHNLGSVIEDEGNAIMDKLLKELSINNCEHY